MKKHGLYVILNYIVGHKLRLQVFEEGTPILIYTVKAKRINNNTIVFSIDSIIRYDIDTSGMDYLTMIGLLYYIANINIDLFDRLVSYNPNDNILFGIERDFAPKAFESNDAFIDALLMENILADDSDDQDKSNVNFDIINIIDGHITFDLNGMQCVRDCFLPEDGSVHIELRY